MQFGYINQTDGVLEWPKTRAKKVVKRMRGFWFKGLFIGIVRYERHPDEPYTTKE